MIHKTALFVASLAAAMTLAFALALAGFTPGAAPAPVVSTDPAPMIGADAPAATPEPTVQIDKVYVAPPQPQRTITVHKVVKTAGGGESDGAEGGD
jgi:hypothetical protein